MENICENVEIFIIDKEIVTEFFKDENYEMAELFFEYLTFSNSKKAFMIPDLFDEIIKRFNEKITDKTLKSEVESYFENWVERADLLGEEKGDEIHDNKLLYKILQLINPQKKVIIISSKYNSEAMSNLSLENLQSYLMSKDKFSEHLRQKYGLNDGASY